MWVSAIRMMRCLVISTLLIGLTVLPGCGKKNALGPLVMGSVKGTVTLDGKAPPAGTQITFTHKERAFPAVAEIGSDGSYTLTFNQKPQVPVGTYDVAVVPSPSSGTNVDPSDHEAYKAMMTGGQVGAKTPLNPTTIPAKYRSAATSGLTCTVLEGQETVFDVKMVSGGGP